MMKVLITIVMVSSCLSGCIGPAPHIETVTPEVSGIVIDAETKETLGGVSVTMVPGQPVGIFFTMHFVDGNAKSSLITDDSGLFKFPPYEDWYFWYYPVPDTGAKHELLLIFSHPDYIDYKYSWNKSFASYAEIPPLNVGTIGLEKK